MQPELIKKTFKQRTKTNIIGENEIEIVPDLDVIYSTKLLLKKRDVDLGFFDPVEQELQQVTTNIPSTTTTTTVAPNTTTAAPTTTTTTESLEPPNNVIATPTNSSVVGVTWIDVSTNENGFQIQVRVGNGNFIDAGTVGVNITDYSYDAQDLYSNNLVDGDVLIHRVRAFNNNESSIWVEAAPITFSDNNGNGDGVNPPPGFE